MDKLLPYLTRGLIVTLLDRALSPLNTNIYISQLAVCKFKFCPIKEGGECGYREHSPFRRVGWFLTNKQVVPL